MTEPTPNADENTGAPTESEFEPILSQEDFDKRTKARIARATAKYGDYSDLQAKAKRLAELETASMTESQKQVERIRALEQQLEKRDSDILRHSVANAKGVPPERISGSTQEELEASADELLTFIAEWNKNQTPKTRPPVAGLKSGATGTDARMDPKERAAAALRQWAGLT